MAFLRRLSLLVSSFTFILASALAHSINIDTNRYDIYFGDVNGDGFEDVYFHGKELFVPIAGDIFIPLILPPSDGFALIRNSRTQTVNGSAGFSDYCGDITHTYHQIIRENGVSDPEFIDLDEADIAGFRAAVDGVDYVGGDFNGDNGIDFLLRNLGAGDANNTQLVSSSPGNCSHVYNQVVVEGGALAITLASTSGDTVPQILQTFTSSSFAVANINTAAISIQDADLDGRDDIIFNSAGEQTVWFAQANGQIDTTQYQSGNNFLKPPAYTGTSAGAFRVAESGAATYSMELPVLVGTSGVQPALSINYASNGGNGLLGRGWSLGGLSSISRCPKTRATDSEVSPIRWNADDRFCMDGQRLIVTRGNYGAPGSLYKTEIDSYVKVMAVGGSAGSPAYFKVLRKDGSVSFYGESTDSKLMGGSHVLSWALSRSEDSVGNQVNYIYNNSPGEQHIEFIRYAYGDSSTDYHAEIQFNYESRPDDTSGFVGGYLFSTSERLRSVDIRNQSNGAWATLRTFNFIYDRIGLSNPASLLSAVQECVSNGNCLPATRFDWQKPEAMASYEPASQLHGFDRNYDLILDRRFLDVNGDGYMDMVVLNQNDSGTIRRTDRYAIRYFISDGQQLTSANFTNGNHWFHFTDAPEPKSIYGNHVKIETLDYNGDGHHDLAVFRSLVGHWQIYLSVPNGNQWQLDSTPIDLTQLNSISYVFADMDANGLVDAVSPNAIHYLLPAANPTQQLPYEFANVSNMTFAAFGTNSTCSRVVGEGEPIEYYPATYAYHFVSTYGDIDGDGDIELVLKKSGNCRSGPAFTEELALVEKQGNQFAILSTHKDSKRRVDHEALQLTDINGDGLTDLVRTSKEQKRWFFRLSNGNGFEPEQYIGESSLYRGAQFADVNADGQQDFIWHDRNNNQLRFRLFDQTGLTATHVLRSTNGSRYESHSFADINADRRVDYIRQYWVESAETGYIQVAMASGSSQPDNTISKITNGLGAETDIHYESIAGSSAYKGLDTELSYRYSSGSSEQQQYGDVSQGIWDLPSGSQSMGIHQPVLPSNGAIFVVARVDSSAPAGSNTQAGAVNTSAKSAIAYEYSGARIQAGGRGFLGFQYLKTVDLQTQIKTTTLYRQDYPFIGSPQKTVTFSPSGDVMQESENDWRYNESLGTDGTHFYQQVLGQVTETGYSTASQSGVVTVSTDLIKQQIVNSTIDAHGNPTQIVTTLNGFGDNALTQTNTVTNTYIGNDLTLSAWGEPASYAELGRVTHTSNVTTLHGDTVTRNSGFSYYTSGDFIGLLQTETIEPNGAQEVTQSTTHFYDEVGNKNRAVTIAWDGHSVVQRTARTEFDSTGRFVDASYNHYGQRVEAVLERDYRNAPIRTENLTGIITTVELDDLGREIRRYDDSSDERVTSEYLRCSQVGNCPSGTAYAMRQTLATGGQSITYFDILGRKIREGSINFNGRWVYTDIEYDNLGRTLRTSEPFYANTVPLWNHSYYDIFGQPWRVIAADGTSATTNYNGLASTSINALGHQKVETTNVLGQLVHVTDNLDGRIGYQYSIDNELTHLYSYDSNNTLVATTLLEYDFLGRKIAMTDPDKGRWIYSYNAFGEMIEQTDAKQQRVAQRYDSMSRMISRTDYTSNGAVEAHTTWVYDNNDRTGREVDNARGQLREVIMASQVSTTCNSSTTRECMRYEYDDIGRQMATEVTLGITSGQLGTYRSSVDYDTYGRAELSYDAIDGEVTNGASAVTSGVRTYYNVYGYAYQSNDLQTGELLQQIIERNQRGQVVEELKGNGARTYSQYDPANGRLLRHNTDVVGLFAVQDITYAWDDIGNLQSRHNQSTNAQGGQNNLQESFCYDGLNRLIKTNPNTASTSLCGGGASSQDIEYTSLGNIIRKQGVGTYTYAHTNNTSAANDAGLHAVTSTSDGRTYQYDNNGNITVERLNGTVSRTLNYTSFDKPYEIVKGNHTTQFAYGAGRSRYWREDTDANGVITTTLYLGGVERITKSNSTSIEWKRYLGHSIYTVTTDEFNNQQSLERLFIYKDHLGSTDVITNSSGQVVQSMSFDPWGQRRNATDWNALSQSALASFDHSKTTKGYTGHEHLNEIGLIHMNGRIYDASLARFLQADPFVQAPSDTQMLNRYSYVRNNPLNATDPSGYFLKSFAKKFGIAGGGLASIGHFGGAYLVNQINSRAAQNDTVAQYAPAIAGAAASAFCGPCGIYVSAIVQADIAYYRTGSLTEATKAAAWTAATGAVFYGVGQAFGDVTLASSYGDIAGKILVHGVTGGTLAHLQGGSFGHGFASAGFSAAVSVSGLAGVGGEGVSVEGVIISAVAGGTASKLSGGKFANGAVTATFGYLFNQASKKNAQKGKPGIAPADPDHVPHLEKMQQLAQEAANEVDASYDTIDTYCKGSCRFLPWLKPMLRGTAIHRVFANKVRALSVSYDAEISYKNGVIVPYSTSGSVRADATYGDINRPQFVVELKTGRFNYMSRGEAQGYLDNLPRGVPVYPLKVD